MIILMSFKMQLIAWIMHMVMFLRSYVSFDISSVNISHFKLFRCILVFMYSSLSLIPYFICKAIFKNTENRGTRYKFEVK